MSNENQQKDSDTIFKVISTSGFDNYDQAKYAVATLYVPDMNFSRAGICHALARLEQFYSDKEYYDNEYKKYSKPENIRRIRELRGYTQEHASLLLFGQPNYFQKYESGEIKPSRGAANLIKLWNIDPDLVEGKIKECNQPKTGSTETPVK